MFSNSQSQTAHQDPGSKWSGCGGYRGGKKFSGFMPPWMKHFTSARIPVNISEDDTSYHLHLYASGLKKEAIVLSVKDDVLSIAYSAPEGEARESGFSHREFEPSSFERLFALNNKVLTGSISAAYADGVLKVTLPKNPETTKPAQKVTVS